MNQITILRNRKPKTTLRLQKNSQSLSINQIQKSETEGKEFRMFPPILFPYQAEFLKDINETDYNVFVYEKSRRIGITHCLAAHAVLDASRQQGKNFFYISTNRENGKDFINSCEYWTRHFQIAGGAVGEELYHDENEDILTLRINFSNGKKIAALASKPSSVRGLQGSILLDEAAFLTNLEEFLKACRALLIWGAKIFVVSTHNGEENPFNKLIEDIKKGKLDYYHRKTTFKDALQDGLYRRICLVSGEEWSEEKEKVWVQKIYKDSGASASEELDVIPASTSINAVFKKADFKICSDENLPKNFDNLVLAWDTAATEKTTSCYTCGILMGKLGTQIYILDWRYCKKDAASTQAFIIDVCNEQDKLVPIYIECEGGSQSIMWLDNAFKPSLPGRKVIGVTPVGSKLLRSIPVAEKVREGHVFVKESHWTEDFLNTIKQFEGIPGIPLITDSADALSLAYSQINQKIGHLINTGTVKKSSGSARYC